MGGLSAVFFIDISSTFILQLLNSCICKENEQRNILVTALVRMIIGFVFNVALFIAICIVNNVDVDVDEDEMFFIVMVAYIVVFYGFAFFGAIHRLIKDFCCKSSRILPDTYSKREDDISILKALNSTSRLLLVKSLVRAALAMYKTFEIVFDILCLLYELSFNDYVVTTDFDIAITVITVLDIVANVIQLAVDYHLCCKDIGCYKDCTCCHCDIEPFGE